MSNYKLHALLASISLAIGLRSAIAQNQFILLHPIDFQGESTFAYGVSPDGSFVSGSLDLSPNGARAYRWSASGSATLLGLLNGPGSAVAYAVSNGGNVLIGDSFTTATGVREGFRWTPGSGMQGIGFLPGDDRSFANDVSADGTTIVGMSGTSSQGQAIIHITGTGMQSLGTLPGFAFNVAQAVSADGSVVAGHSEGGLGGFRTFRWTAQTGLVDLGFGGDVGDISSDGSVIVGGTGVGPFRWTQSGGLMQLPLNHGMATGVTANGQTIVGNGQFGSSGPDHPFIWDPQMGLRQLQSYLQNEVGLDLDGFTLRNVSSISDDGRVIVGFGDLPGGPGRGFVAIVPAPSAAFTFILTFLFASRRRS